jgi:hypothetical protein
MVTSNYDNLLTAQELEEYHAQRVDVRRRAEHPAQLVGSSVPKRTRAGCGYTYYGHTILAYLHRYRGMATTAHSAYTSKPAMSSHYYGHTHCGYTYHGYTYHGYTIVNVLEQAVAILTMAILYDTKCTRAGSNTYYGSTIR